MRVFSKSGHGALTGKQVVKAHLRLKGSNSISSNVCSALLLQLRACVNSEAKALPALRI